MSKDYILVPDNGGLAMPALRAPLAHLARHQAASPRPPTLAIATTTPRRLLRHLPHTLGTDRVFADIARAARSSPFGGALLEWRGPAACAHGRLRPDGYGLLRVGAEHYGFLLEFDRGSMHDGRLRAKFAAYYRYAASARAVGVTRDSPRSWSCARVRAESNACPERSLLRMLDMARDCKCCSRRQAGSKLRRRARRLGTKS